jgi:type 1 glutamine amidotransferase
MILRHRFPLGFRVCLAAFAMAVFSLALSSAVAADAALKIHIIADGHYDAKTSLAEFKDYLEKNYNVSCTASWGGEAGASRLDNLDELKTADLLLLFVRRMNLREPQMAIIRAHWEQGKPIVGLRTACHAFQKADNEIIDRQVFGGHYGGGEGSSNGAYRAATAEGAADHPILKGVTPFKANKYYYANGKLADDATVLQVFESTKYGKLPVTWVHNFKGGRMFYSMTGAAEDFKDDNFRTMLVNAIFWTTHREPEKMKK